MLDTLLKQLTTTLSFPVTGPDGFVIEAGPRAEAHLLINKVIESLPRNVRALGPLLHFSLQDILDEYLDSASRKERIAVIFAVMERSVALEEQGWSYRPITTRFLQHAKPGLFETEDYVTYFSLFVGQGGPHLTPYACDRVVDRLANHVDKTGLPDTLRNALEQFTALIAPAVGSGSWNAPVWTQAKIILGQYDPVAEMNALLPVEDFGQGSCVGRCADGFPLYDQDPLAAQHREIDALFAECEQQGVRSYNLFLHRKELRTLQQMLETDRAVQKQYVLAAFYRMAWARVHAQSLSFPIYFVDFFLKRRLPFTEAEILFVFRYMSAGVIEPTTINFSGFLKSVEVYLKEEGLRPALTEAFQAFLDAQQSVDQHKGRDKIRLQAQAIFMNTGGTAAAAPYQLNEDDAFGQRVNAYVAAQPEVARRAWYALLEHCSKASSARPSKKYQREAAARIDGVQPEVFLAAMKDWMDVLVAMDATRESEWWIFYLKGMNVEVAKGLVWCLAGRADAEALQGLDRLAMRCFRKIPGQGASCAGLGNACLYVLGHSGGLDGVGILSNLKTRIRQKSTRDLIDRYLAAAAEGLGLTPDEIEDRAVPDYELCAGTRTYAFGDYTATLRILALGKTEVRWQRPDGRVQKSAPAAVKAQYKDDLKAISATAKAIKKTLSAQRDRLDRSYIADRTWTYAAFRAYYLDHGLVSFIARRLIWEMEIDGASQAVFHHDGVWIDADGAAVETISDDARVRLWHPVEKPVEHVMQWRDFITEREIVQPIKQAFREVYVLTDAERATERYSNRMAAHILKQSQFNGLVQARRWSYVLQLAYDDCADIERARFAIPAHGLEAEFWVNFIADDHSWTDSGVWLYVSTDQVRFLKNGEVEPLLLEAVPPLVFSEVMRDVDLFVGVASMGNDPAWQDTGGDPRYRDYWYQYAFGDLGATAQTRRSLLEKMVPRLKIADVCTLTDRFLVVKGTRRSYKIHLGSGNILMTPNDEYLCIVPDAGMRRSAEDFYLPFEGERMLSIILSKAFLVAADDQITDPTILSQLRRK